MTQIEDLAFWKSLTDEDFFNTAAPAKSRDEGLKLLKRRDTSINRVQFSLRAERLNLDIFTSTLKRGSPLDKQRRRGQKRLEEKARALKARANHLTLVHAHHRPTTSSWQDLSDEQFREIVERSKNISQAFKEMKVSHTTANKHILLEWAGFLEIDISHFPKMPIDSVPHWKLTAAIERSTSYTALARDLRITPNSENLRELRAYVTTRTLAASAGKEYKNPFTRRWAEVSKKELEEALNKYSTFREISLHLGCTAHGSVGGSNAKVFYARVKQLDIIIPFVPNEQPFYELTSLRKRRFWLLKDRGHICENCGRKEHNNRYLPLELHHEDEDKTHNTLDNLSLLCNNCHAQQHNRGKRTSIKGAIKYQPFHTIRSDASLRLALIRERSHKCEGCSIIEWQGNYLPLEMHHVDCNRKNNHPANLKLLCSNCHAIVHKKGQTWQEHEARAYSDKLDAQRKRFRAGEVNKRIKKLKKVQGTGKKFHPSGFFTDPDDY